jgi:hypothetical protein
MSTTESRIVAIDGEELLAGIRREASEQDGWVHAVGHVEHADIKFAGQGADRRRNISARATLASFGGPIGGPYGATLVRESHAGVEVYAGILLSARSLGVTVVIVPAHVSESIRQDRAAAGASAVAGAEDDYEQALPEVGDLVRHFAFGLCEVLIVTGDRLKIRDVAPPERVRDISIERLKITGPTEERGKRLFMLERKS